MGKADLVFVALVASLLSSLSARQLTLGALDARHAWMAPLHPLFAPIVNQKPRLLTVAAREELRMEATDSRMPQTLVYARELRDTLGFLGVIGSLVFVGLEVRQNTRVARAEAYRAAQETVIDWSFVAASDDELVPLLRAVTFEGQRRDNLSNADKWRVGTMYDALIRGYESVYRQVQERILPPDALDRYITTGFTTPYMKDLWPVIRSNYREDFARHFETRFELGK